MNVDVYCSIIIGIFVGLCLFYLTRKNNVYRGPDSNIIKSKIYKLSGDNKCYVLEPKIYIC